MKVALVTGGSKGLGKEISQSLALAGFTVYAGAREMGGKIEGVLPVQLDVTHEAQCESVIEKIIKKEKRLDLLVNNAGVNSEDLEVAFMTNVFGPYFLIKHATEHLEKAKGRIINITSLNGLVPVPNAPVYSASKHALESMGISLAYSLAQKGILVSNVAPGAIYNPEAKKLGYKTLREKYPFLKTVFPLITKGRVAEAVVELAKMERPPRRVVVGLDAKMAFFVSRTFPGLWFYLMNKLYS